MMSWMSFLNRPKRLVALVTAAHLLALLLFVVSKTPTPTKKEPTPLIVKTVKLKPPPKPQVVVAAPKPQPKSKPKPKPQAVAAAPKPKSKPKPKPSVAKAKRPAEKKPDNRLAKLVQEAQNKLAKVDEKVKAAPRQMQLAIDQGSYEEELAERLRLLLKLPEWGSVRVALTLNREGVVCGVEILSAQSETNRDYVISRLERTTLAPFGQHFGGQRQHTFTLTLNNEL